MERDTETDRQWHLDFHLSCPDDKAEISEKQWLLKCACDLGEVDFHPDIQISLIWGFSSGWAD